MINTPNYSHSDFMAYLNRSKEDTFVLDLSECSMLEIIDEMVKVKSQLSPNCGKQFHCLRKNLRDLEEAFGCKVMPHQITDVFWYNFVPFLINKGLAISTIKTVSAQMRSALSWASRHRAKISTTFDFIKIPSYCHQQIALTADDVSHIYHFDINSMPRRKQYLRHMEKVRDMFVLSCNLGQRFSDMVRIDEACFDRNIFTIMQQKTGALARVDIERMSIDRNTTYKILEKYNYRAPITTDISNYNRYLKELLRFIGFEEAVRRQTRINGIVDVKMHKRWQLISSHTARRTFATINLLRGFKCAEIRRATGHKTESAFEKYICYFDD